MPQTARQHQRTPGRDGLWPGTWETTSAPPTARKWSLGWDRGAKCPPDPLRRSKGSRSFGAAPEGGWCRGPHWRDAWTDTRRVARTLRRAGYVARHRWDRVDAEERQIGRTRIRLQRYQTGPAAGQVAQDPWELAAALSSCSSSWYTQLRHTSAGLVLVKCPRRCGRRHVCPTCAQATSSSLARALRAVVEDKRIAGELGPLALVTLTQRVNLDEDLIQALERLRWSISLLTREDPELRRTWGGLVASWYVGLEVTRSWRGKGEGAPEPESESAMGWHVHAHLVLELEPEAVLALRSDGWADPIAGARQAIGLAWQEASRAAAAERGLEGYGWDPVAGGCQPLEPLGGEVGSHDYSGRWWVPIDPESPVEVYQAAKYPTPLCSLGPVGMAEWVSVAYGRRWHQGGGGFRSVRKLAAELEAAGAGPDAVTTEDGDTLTPPDLGDLVTRCGPGESPPAEPTDTAIPWSWRLMVPKLEDVPAELADAIADVGGHTWRRTVHHRGEPPEHQAWVTLPSAWCWWSTADTDARILEHHQAIEEARARAQSKS